MEQDGAEIPAKKDIPQPAEDPFEELYLDPVNELYL
jgi:hypothetical protein